MTTKNNNKIIASGHNACAGCGELVAAQAVARALVGQPIIIANATGCLEVTTTSYPQSSWGAPWLHSLFENAAATASGILAALKSKGDNKTKVVVNAGDGATYDIGLGLISGMWSRGENILYICFDTEAYSNTGVQSSSATPYGASTTTNPSGLNKISDNKKDMLAIALAHGVNYVAQANAAFPDDITNKVKKALAVSGPAYIQILSPCIPGWKIKTDEAVLAGRLATKTALYPLLEYVNGKLSASSINQNFKAITVLDYLKLQGRFSHLKENDITEIQKIADYNIKKYSL